MTLSFSTKWDKRMGELAGHPNYFIDNIWDCIVDKDVKVNGTYDDLYKVRQWRKFYRDYHNKTGECWDSKPGSQPKPHTIRHYPHDRWEAGMDIHMVINNRTKNRFQFAPVVKCVSTQYISISYQDSYPVVFIGNTKGSAMPFYWENLKGYEDGYGVEQMQQLALNDGFPSVEAFFQYFNKDFKGKIIHWTDLKY